MLGRNYANDNFNDIYVPGMTHDEFAKEALENYNNNADAFNEPCLQEEYEKDFLFGAKQSMRDMCVIIGPYGEKVAIDTENRIVFDSDGRCDGSKNELEILGAMYHAANNAPCGRMANQEVFTEDEDGSIWVAVISYRNTPTDEFTCFASVVYSLEDNGPNCIRIFAKQEEADADYQNNIDLYAENPA